MEIVQTSTESMLIIECNDEALGYFWYRNDILLNFDSDSEVTEKWFYFWPVTEKTWLYCNSSQVKVRSSWSDCWWSISRSVVWLKKRKAQARIYVRATSWWWDQHFAVWGFNWGNLRNSNNPWHHLAMTTSSWYRGNSWIWTWNSQWAEYWNWWFTGWYVYEIEYDNWTYTMTRYNDTSEVTDTSTYTHRKTFEWLWEAEYVWIWLRHGFSSENYNVADWFRFFY